jgi:hypothetical protein
LFRQTVPNVDPRQTAFHPVVISRPEILGMVESAKQHSDFRGVIILKSEGAFRIVRKSHAEQSVRNGAGQGSPTKPRIAGEATQGSQRLRRWHGGTCCNDNSALVESATW